MILSEILKLRADLLQKVRCFFHERGVLEVETPTLSQFPALDLHIEPFQTTFGGGPSENLESPDLFLQSSPEYAMKRLLANGSGPIFQITKAFRNGEVGHLHNPEFTIIEWYRPGFYLDDMMNESAAFVENLLHTQKTVQTTYTDVFLSAIGLSPLDATLSDLRNKTEELGLFPPAGLGDDKDGWLSFLLTEKIEPLLGITSPQIVSHFPSSQAAMAKLDQESPPSAERFELYLNGIELCNGYHELQDSSEQEKRFTRENALRVRHGKNELPVDKRLLQAIKKGLPQCSGVAFGFDRLVMLKANAKQVSDILPFPISEA